MLRPKVGKDKNCFQFLYYSRRNMHMHKLLCIMQIPDIYMSYNSNERYLHLYPNEISFGRYWCLTWRCLGVKILLARARVFEAKGWLMFAFRSPPASHQVGTDCGATYSQCLPRASSWSCPPFQFHHHTLLKLLWTLPWTRIPISYPTSEVLTQRYKPSAKYLTKLSIPN